MILRLSLSSSFLICSALSLSSSPPPPPSSSSSPPIDATLASSVRGARHLGSSNLIVSSACLGTMTFGVQNNQIEANAQLDYATKSAGINFIDTAELYPVPLTAPTWKAGVTEEMVGNYLHGIGKSERDRLVVATKICGYFPNSPVAGVRTVPPTTQEPFPDCRLDAKSVRMACDASLRRLQTDRIDLMQIHWPDRYTPLWGQTSFRHDSIRTDAVPIEETAGALRDLMEEGKIRTIGLSNESPYGVMEWIHACSKLGIADRLVTIQNSYSLLDRRFDGDLAEICQAHRIGLMPWSILAGGLLTGKYRTNNNQTPPSPNARFVKYPQYMSRWSPSTASSATLSAVEEYSEIAAQWGMTPAELAIKFVKSRVFVEEGGSTIVGAVTMEQLKENLRSFGDGSDGMVLDEGLLEAVDRVHMKCRDPSCAL